MAPLPSNVISYLARNYVWNGNHEISSVVRSSRSLRASTSATSSDVSRWNVARCGDAFMASNHRVVIRIEEAAGDYGEQNVLGQRGYLIVFQPCPRQIACQRYPCPGSRSSIPLLMATVERNSPPCRANDGTFPDRSSCGVPSACWSEANEYTRCRDAGDYSAR